MIRRRLFPLLATLFGVGGLLLIPAASGASGASHASHDTGGSHPKPKPKPHCDPHPEHGKDNEHGHVDCSSP
jgi:hypothetical protein